MAKKQDFIIKAVSNEIARDVLVNEIAESVAQVEAEKIKPKTGLPQTVILKETYVHPKTPQCKGCPHPEGRYVHPTEPVCTIPSYVHPKEKICVHDHSGERLNPVYCTLRSYNAVQIQGVTVDDSSLADNKILVYDAATKKLKYETPAAGAGDMTKAVYDTNDDGVVDNSAKLELSTKAQVQDHTPKAHTLGSHSADTLANLNAKVSDATLDDSSATRTPSAHDLAGAAHNADTLADLNTKISDATLLDTTAIQFKTGALHAAADHQNGGALEIRLDDFKATEDNTDLDVSTSAHGLCPKAPNDVTQFLNGLGAWSVPAGGSGVSKGQFVSANIYQTTTSTYYFSLTYSGLSTVEGQKTSLHPAMTLKKLRYFCYQFDAGKSNVYVRLKQNGNNTDLFINITGVGIFSVTADVAVSDNDRLEYETSGSGAGYMRGNATLEYERS